MNRALVLVLIFHTAVVCAQPEGVHNINMPSLPELVEGVGGVFVFSNDAKRLADWYREYLGIPLQGSAEHGFFYHAFQAVAPDDPARQLNTNFSILQATVPLPKREIPHEPQNMYGDQPYMVNLQVRDLEATLSYLETKGVEPIKREDYPYGRFAWVRDGDGNRIELFQPQAPPAQGSATEPKSPLQKLRWLVGTWRRETSKSISTETWRRLSDRTFEGEGVRLSTASGDTAFTESLRIVEMQGETFYLAKVAENPYPVAFKLTSFDSAQAVFENPDHDFPQRITYRHPASDSLTVLVAGDVQGKPRVIRFRFSKVK